MKARHPRCRAVALAVSSPALLRSACTARISEARTADHRSNGVGYSLGWEGYAPATSFDDEAG